MSSNSNNKKLSRSEAEQLIYPKTDYIDEQIDKLNKALKERNEG